MASRGINKVILVGNLGQDPEVKYMPNGSAVTNITVATSETWKDKESGQPQERTEWHRVVFFNRLAEIAGEYLRKGSKVYLEGALRTRKWQDQSGQDRYTTEVVASEMQMLDSMPNGGNQQNAPQQQRPQNAPQQQRPQNGYQQNAPQQQRPQQRPQQNAPQHQMPQGGYQNPPAGFDEFDEDIPF